MLKKLFIPALLLCASITFSACSDSNNEPTVSVEQFIGTWQIQENSATLNYTLNPNLDAMIQGMGMGAGASSAALTQAMDEVVKPAVVQLCNTLLRTITVNSNNTYTLNDSSRNPYELTGNKLVLKLTVDSAANTTVNLATLNVNNNEVTFTIPKEYMGSGLLGQTFAGALPGANSEQMNMMFNFAFTSLEATAKYNRAQ